MESLPSLQTIADALLAPARAYLEALVEGRPAAPALPEAEVGGLFVTLYDEDGEMRGSAGTSAADRPLPALLTEAVRIAASDDPRFPPVSRDEAARIRIAVTVLGAGRRITGPDEVEPGVTALHLRRGVRSGTMLPEVTMGRGWDAPVLLAYASTKAGLFADAWKDPTTEVTAFPSARAVETR